MGVKENDLVVFSMFGLKVLTEVYAVETTMPGETYDASVKIGDREMICSYNPRLGTLSVELVVDDDIDNLITRTWNGDIVPLVVSDNMSKAAATEFKNNANRVMDLLMELDEPKPKDHDILEMTILGHDVFVDVKKVSGQDFTFVISDGHTQPPMRGHYHADWRGQSVVLLNGYQACPASYKILDRVCPSEGPKYRKAYMSLVEELEAPTASWHRSSEDEMTPHDMNVAMQQLVDIEDEIKTDANPTHVKRTDMDGEIYLVQTASVFDPMLHFGPLKCSLSDLMHEGFDLTVLGYRSQRGSERRATLYLTRKGERYKICRKFMHEFLASDDLSEFVKEQNLTHKLNLNVEYKELPFTPAVVEERDPYDALLERHPTVKKRSELMIGNQPLREFVRGTRIKEVF